jgi:hypothetical protein
MEPTGSLKAVTAPIAMPALPKEVVLWFTKFLYYYTLSGDMVLGTLRMLRQQLLFRVSDWCRFLDCVVQAHWVQEVLVQHPSPVFLPGYKNLFRWPWAFPSPRISCGQWDMSHFQSRTVE